MTLDELRNSRILVTGATGFLGRHLTSLLTKLECRSVTQTSSFGHDLTDDTDVHRLFNPVGNSNPYEVVFHLGGWNGGLQLNLREPATIFLRNTKMALNLLEACQQTGVKKVVSVVASCAYPEWELDCWGDSDTYGDDVYTRVRREKMSEADFLDGPPHPSVACHGYAKRNLQLASSYFKKQYGLNAVCVCPTTLFGPGDSFDPERTKVMGGMVKRFVDAADEGLDTASVWGSGKPMREFLYAPDAAGLIVESALKYDDSDLPLNLGTGQEFTIRRLAEIVADASGYKGLIEFDASKPDGQFRKRLDLTRMTQFLGPFEPTPFAEGVAATVSYYRGLKKGKA